MDQRRTESAQRICVQACASTANEGWRRCREKSDEVQRENCFSRVEAASTACREGCAAIEIDGKVGGVELGD